MIINPAELIESGERVKVQSLIEYSGKKEVLWYSFPKKFAPFLTLKLDGFLVGLLLLAMKHGEDVTVKGAVSEKLYFNLTNSYMNVIQVVFPELKPVKIHADKLDDGTAESCECFVGTGFSGGVDSFCTIHDHFFNATLPAYKITHLVFTNVGSHNEWDSKLAKKLFNLRYDLLKDYTKELGLDFITIDSNLSDVLNWNFLQTHVPRNFSAVLFLQKLFSKYYYSSSNRYADCSVLPNRDISLVEPVIDHLMSTEALDFVSVGCEYSRVEKTERVVKVPGSNRWLNVCVHSLDGTNCSMCFKCARTLVALELLGVVDDFGDVFDLKKWQKARRWYLIRLLEDKNNEYIREIREYANKIGYNFKPWYIVASKIFNSKLLSPIVNHFNLRPYPKT